MIGRIETLAFENDPDRHIHLAQRFLVALWTPAQGDIIKFLLAFKLHTAVLAPVSINGHT